MGFKILAATVKSKFGDHGFGPFLST